MSAPEASAGERPARPLDIVMVIDSLGPGGAERLVETLAPRLQAREHRVRVVHFFERGGNPYADSLRRAGVPVVRVPVSRLLDPRPVQRLVRIIRGADVVHCHLRYADLLGRMAGRVAGVPVVSTHHLIRETETGAGATIRRWIEQQSARWLASRVVTISSAQRAVYRDQFPVAPDRVVMIYNGVDTDRFRPDPAARQRLRAALGIVPDRTLWATVAVLRPGKGIADLLKAFRLRSGQADILLIAGDGPERADLEALAGSLDIADRVRFLGARSDIPAVLATSDGYIHPSHFEALPTAVLEAMATALPVVATAVGGSLDLVQPGRTGVLVPVGDPGALADAIEELGDPARRRLFGEAGRRWVIENASLDGWVERLESLYREVGA